MFMPMNTQWGDYCGGFTYEIIYVSGPFENNPHPSGDLTLKGPDLTNVFTIEYPVSSDYNNHYVDSKVPNLTWLGTHVFKIRGLNGGESSKTYKTIESGDFRIEWINPCLTTTVLDRTINDMITTVKLFEKVNQVYLNNED